MTDAEETSSPSQLHTTAWSMVNGAAQSGPDQQACLDRLIRTYWRPAYYYARRRGLDHHAASDAIQEFFTRMLAGEWLSTVDRARGSFRGWLLTALRRWVSRRRTATGMDRLTLVSDDAVRSYEREIPDSDPETLFNKAWARSCLDAAFALMESEQQGGTRGRQVAVLKACLGAAGDDSSVSYDQLSARFQVPVTTITNDLHRARTLFRTYLKRVVADTVGDPAEVEAEIEALRNHLGA